MHLIRPCSAFLAALLPILGASAVESQLTVTAYDDNLPSGSSLTYAWTVSPGTATTSGAVEFIPSANVRNPRVKFTAAGSYVFRVAVSDGHLTTQGSAVQNVTIVVNPVPNAAPTLSSFDKTLIAKGTSTGPLNFTITDDGPLGELVLSFSSSNKTLVPDANGVFSGTGTNRTLTVTPVSTMNGTTEITVSVKDGGNLMTSKTFILTVNAPPVITSVSANNNNLTLP